MHVQSCMILWGLIFSNLFGVHFETLVSSQIQTFRMQNICKDKGIRRLIIYTCKVQHSCCNNWYDLKGNGFL